VRKTIYLVSTLTALALTATGCLAPPADSEPAEPAVPAGPADPSSTPSDPTEPADPPTDPPTDPMDPADPPAPADPPNDPVDPPEPMDPVGGGIDNPSPLCPALPVAADDPMFVSLEDGFATLFDGSGNTTDLTAKVATQIPAGAINYNSSVYAAKGWFVFKESWLLNHPFNPQESGTTLTGLTNDGTVLWSMALEGTQWKALVRDDRHALIIAEGLGADLWVAPDGTATDVELENGKYLRALRGDYAWAQYYGGDYEQCWTHIPTGETSGCFKETDYSRIIGDTAYALKTVDGVPSVVALDVDGTTQTTPIAGAPDGNLYLTQFTASGWAVGMTYDDPTSRFRLHLPTAQLLPITPTLPEGWTMMAPCNNSEAQVGVADDGSVMVGLLDAAFASAVFAWEPETDTLEQLTPAVAGVGHVWFHAGTHGYRASMEGWNSYYCWQPTGDPNDIEWDSAMGNMMLYADNTETSPVAMDGWGHAKSDPSGLCALHHDAMTPSETYEVLDVSTGTWTGSLSGLGTVVWLEPEAP